jgi:3-deoxy-D-manno-octulosonic-acid transferase
VALLGGSFEPLGGQNLIEAAACGCPVVMGPHTFNFSEAAQLAQEAGAATRVGSLEEGIRTALDLASNASRRKAAVAAAAGFAAAHRGAADKTADALLALLAR